MILAVASGKGGTGKTTVSASLASVWPSPIVAVDLDVEEPNLHLFMKPDIRTQEPSYIEIPEIDDIRCTRCRACSRKCATVAAPAGRYARKRPSPPANANWGKS